MSIGSFVFAYLLGGVTLIPLLLFSFLYLHPVKQNTNEDDEENDNQNFIRPIKAGEIEENNSTGLDAYKLGWITVTTEYIESSDNINSLTQTVTDSQEGKSAYSSLYKLVRNSNTKGKDGKEKDFVEDDPNVTAAAAATATTNSGAKSGSKKHRYYGVLKHGNLFLYKNESLKDVKHVVVLSHLIVLVWPRDLLDAQVFSKYSLIAILKKDWNRKRRLLEGNEGNFTISDVADPSSNLPPPPGTFFIYTDCNIDKEDWYFALIKASKTDSSSISRQLDPNIQAKTLHFETRHMVDLIQLLYSSEGQLHTKWFNAIIGRLFLSLLQTQTMKNYLIAKIEKKLNKMKMPGFLDKFQITKVDAGTGAPLISFPTLREINPEGDLLVSFNVHYYGKIAAQLATKVNINLGSRFKTREMDVLLLMKLEKLQGPMLIRIKPPPSGRIWYAFELQPIMDINVEPIISSRQLSYNIITNSIEKKLKEAVRTSLVLPNWDDFIFYNTESEVYRGGIWDELVRETQEEQEDDKSAHEESEEFMSQLEGQQEDDALIVASGLSADALDIDSVSDKADLSEESVAPPKQTRMRFASTISDISKKLKKTKSTHTIGVDGTNCFSDGSVETAHKEEHESDTNSKDSTLGRIGKWYYKDAPASPVKSVYSPPEMISNRRPRKTSSANYLNDAIKQATDSNGKGFSYAFNSKAPDDVLGSSENASSTALLPLPDIRGNNESQLPELQPTRAKSMHRKPPPSEMEDKELLEAIQN